VVVVKRFAGVLNSDDQNPDILPAQHIQALNGRFYGGANGLSFQNIRGNYLINNASLPGGENECIGAFYDSVKRRIIWFNWNSNGDNGIYQLSINTELISPIFICGTNSATDILNFSPNYPVHSAALVYRTQGDGDLLYWTDGNNRPKYLNLDTVAALSPFISDMLNAGKDWPMQTLSVIYANDANFNVNNLAKRLFRFAYRFLFSNLEKSAFSSLSKMPLPIDGFNQTNLTDPTKNNTIIIEGVARLSDNTTVGDITGVEIAGQECQGSTWSDYFSITTIPASDFTLGTFTFRFTNDSVYTTIPIEESDLYYSYLPDKANTLEVLNGNVIIYGGITEGYPNLAESQCEVYMYSGLGEGEGALVINAENISDTELTVIIGGSAASNTTIQLRVRYDNGVVFTIDVSYTPGLTDTLSDITTAFTALLNAELVTLGINTEVSATQAGTGNTISIVTTNPAGSFPDQYVEYTNLSSFTVPYPNSVLKWSSQYRWGLIYFDERGKTNGVISFVNTETVLNNFGYNSRDFATMSEPPSNQYIPYMMASINHLPPSWARRFQWVRTSNQTTNSYIELVTNDYQTDTDYLYFCIQNLTYLKTKNTGFIPSYDFKEGDRIRVIANYNPANGDRTLYAPVLDFEVLGTVQRTMTSPASLGRFIKVKKPSTSFPAYTANSFIELYSPLLRTNGDEQVFFEFGETFEINANQPGSGQLYHGGNLQEQNATQPATFLFYKGDNYFKPRIFYLDVDATTTKTMTVMDTGYSDYFLSKVNSDGRGWPINPDAKTEYNGVLVRWGGAYQPGTNINRLNIFQEDEYDEAIRSYGDIRRFKIREKILRTFQDRGVGQWGVYSRFIQNNDGDNQLVTTNVIITQNNINYYQGMYGLGGYPTNLCSSADADYFNDVITGREVRLAGDGLNDLGLLYKGQFTLSGYVTPYNRTQIRPNGFIAKVMKYWDSFESEAHTILQGTNVLPDRNYCFNETRNGFTGDFDEHPEWALSADDNVYMFLNGQLWKKSDLAPYCNFFGQQYDCSITVVFNPEGMPKKGWQSISEDADVIWAVPIAYTDTKSYGAQRQETNLVEAEFKILEAMPSASWKRDVNSRGGKWNGDFMKGNWLVAKFQITNASELVNLNELICRYIDSPLNVR